MAKKINPESARQQVFQVLYDVNAPIKAADIEKILVGRGWDKKKIHVHSHLQAFLGQKVKIVTQDLNNGTYEITQAGLDKYEADRGQNLDATEPELVTA